MGMTYRFDRSVDRYSEKGRLCSKRHIISFNETGDLIYQMKDPKM